jgi:hypothetical protein
MRAVGDVAAAVAVFGRLGFAGLAVATGRNANVVNKTVYDDGDGTNGLHDDGKERG